MTDPKRVTEPKEKRISAEDIIAQAKRQCAEPADSLFEIDPDANFSATTKTDTYVAAWVWVNYDDI